MNIASRIKKRIYDLKINGAPVLLHRKRSEDSGTRKPMLSITSRLPRRISKHKHKHQSHWPWSETKPPKVCCKSLILTLAWQAWVQINVAPPRNQSRFFLPRSSRDIDLFFSSSPLPSLSSLSFSLLLLSFPLISRLSPCVYCLLSAVHAMYYTPIALTLRVHLI